MEQARLIIILRTCGNSGVLENTAKRISGTDRPTLIKKCTKSLIESINHAKDLISMKLYVLDDNSTEEFLGELKSIIDDCQIDHELVSLGPKPDEFKHSFNYSAHEQFRYGRDLSNKLVYFVEDDYLHSVDAISSMLGFYFSMRPLTDLNSIALYPYDSTHNYSTPNSEPSRLVYFEDRLWRTTTKTANTMFIHSDEVRRYWPLFDTIARKYEFGGEIYEDHTINRMWNNGVTYGGPITLFSPIPSIAIHVSFAEPIKLTQQLNDWRQRYDEITL